MTSIEVFSHDLEQPRRVGTLTPSFMGASLAGASFEYDRAFLTTGYALSPELRPSTPAPLEQYVVFCGRVNRKPADP